MRNQLRKVTFFVFIVIQTVFSQNSFYVKYHSKAMDVANNQILLYNYEDNNYQIKWASEIDDFSGFQIGDCDNDGEEELVKVYNSYFKVTLNVKCVKYVKNT